MNTSYRILMLWYLLQELWQVLHKGAEGTATDCQWFSASVQLWCWCAVNTDRARRRPEV